MTTTTAITTANAQTVSTASAGALLMDMAAMDRLERIADLMVSGKATVPQHLRGSKGDCFAVALQSMQWGMNPFAVAQKTHMTQSGALGYEAQLISAVVTESGAVDGDPEYEFLGDWDKILGKVEERKSDKGGKYYVANWQKSDEAGLGVICRLRLRGESTSREMKVMLSQCYPRFSTQWATDPKTQITYVAIRKWSRVHKPGVILGVYTPEELQGSQEIHMGMAEEVPPPLPQQPPERTETASRAQEPATESFYPQADFEKNLPQWVKVVTSGRKTLGAMLTFVQSKAKLSPEQIQTFTDAVAKAQANTVDVEAKTVPGAPVVNVETLLADMQAASTCDQLYERAALIDAVTDADQRKRLVDAFDARNNELKEQQ